MSSATFNVVVAGSFKTGKSAFITRNISDVFSAGPYIPTLEPKNSRLTLDLPGGDVNFKITEHPGDLAPSVGCDALILFVNFHNSNSILYALEVIKKSETKCLIICQSFCDSKSAMIDEAFMQNYFKSADACYSVSALTGANVDDPFLRAAQALMRDNLPTPKPDNSWMTNLNITKLMQCEFAADVANNIIIDLINARIIFEFPKKSIIEIDAFTKDDIIPRAKQIRVDYAGAKIIIEFSTKSPGVDITDFIKNNFVQAAKSVNIDFENSSIQIIS